MKKFTLALLVILPICAGPQRCAADGAHPSVWVHPSPNGDVLYATDVSGLRLNDFSECGYKRGQVELPNVTNVVELDRWLFLHPLGGGQDDGAGINAALNYVGSFSPNSNGFRGVVCLGPGEYLVSLTNAIQLTNNGCVLKGSGTSANSGTILRATFQAVGDIISVTSDSEPFGLDDTAMQFNEDFVPAGTRTFRVFSALPFTVGDMVWITHVAAPNWIHDMDMDHLAKVWLGPGSSSGDYERQITRIEGNWITVDTPVPQSFEARYGGGTIRRLAPDTRVQNCGVEDLACTFGVDPGSDDSKHPAAAVRVHNAVDVWVRNVVASGYLSSCVVSDARTKFVTVAQCQMYTSGGFHNRYAFLIDALAAYNLVRDCYSKDSRHDYLTGGDGVPGPNAFVRSTTDSSNDNTGPHQRWATGVLFDNIFVHGNELNVENRGNEGEGHDGHGWVGGYCVVWNCWAENNFRVRNPPTARNWLIGSDGDEMASKRGCWYSFLDFLPFVGDGDCWAVGLDPDGTYDQSGKGSPPVQLHSLYYAQLQQRLKWPGSQFREYRLGDIGWNPGLDNNIPVDTNWLAQVQSLAGPAVATNMFDIVDPNQWTAFTFNFPIDPNTQVVAGSLSLSLSVPPGAHHLYLNTVDVGQSFSDLGWAPANDGAARYTVALPPSALQGGQLNVAIDANCGVDFAMLNFQQAPALPATTEMEYTFDTYVRGGSYADQNFSTDPELIVKQDSDASYSRRAFLSWNLIEVSRPVVDAKLRLYCNYSGQSNNEQSVAVVPDDSWSPYTATWNNQPATDPPLAYFLPSAGSFVEITVTPQVVAALSKSRKWFSLCIDSARDWGSAGDVAYASTRDPDQTHWPELILNFAHLPPTIIGPADQNMGSNTTLGPLSVTVGDAETAASQLVLSATSSAPSVIANSEILLGGIGSNRTVTITIPGGRSGTSIITLTMSDGFQVATTSFRVVVNCANPPFVSTFTNQVTDENIPLTVPFNISSACASADTLSVQVWSSNVQLFPPGSLQVFPQSGSFNRVLVLTPAPYQSGTATISVDVSDGSDSTIPSFQVTVRRVEHPPSYVRITSPHSGDNLLPGVSAVLSADALDMDTNLALIEFYAQPNLLLGSATNAPYSVTWSNPPAGSFTLYAIAYAATGLTATSPPVNLTVSVPVFYPPRLYIGSQSNTIAVVWLDAFGSNALQTATDLTPPVVWSRATNAPQPGEGSWFYFISPTEQRRFYRLAY